MVGVCLVTEPVSVRFEGGLAFVAYVSGTESFEYAIPMLDFARGHEDAIAKLAQWRAEFASGGKG